MYVERCCHVCGAINQTGETLCFACGHSFKTTRPLPALTAYEVLHGSLLFGRYRVQEQVGTGGFSAVFKALDTIENRLVAIKALSLQGLPAQEKIEATDAFNREVQFLSLLQHRNLPRIYEHFSEANCWYIVMDFIDGTSLETHLEDKSHHMTLDEVLDLALVLCDVLEYLHAGSPMIIFRDLKPSNIMLTSDGRLYLIDFGIARHFIPGRKKDTHPFGSPGYAAPEQYGRAQTTPRSDIYSLGAILHQLLTGSDPALTPFQFSAIRQSNPAVPQELEELIATMVERDVDQRPESIALVKKRLRAIVKQRGVQSGLSAVAGISSPAGTVSVPFTQAGVSAAAMATMLSQQAQTSVYYIPSSQWPLVSRSSQIRLWAITLINVVFNFLSLYIIFGALVSCNTGHWTNYFPFPFFITRTPLGPLILPLLNIIGLICGNIALRRIKKVLYLRLGGPKIQQTTQITKDINGCGLGMGYFLLAIWGLILLLIILFSILSLFARG
ncbi:MAG TPA: serine/threonine-protein kinase [Ktedonobacteraceae bacterium]|nr:serine/threonine-protein kinase [Ktedonobacteraceae bacterium]